MTDLPPDLAAFASLLDAQPEPARAAFAYCLGDTFSIAKPRITNGREFLQLAMDGKLQRRRVGQAATASDQGTPGATLAAN